MAGLGSVNQTSGTYLTVAGGFLWNRKADASDPDYAVQEFTRQDGTKDQRSGAQYKDIAGTIKDVVFSNHPKYGQNINVHIDVNGDIYIVSIGTNNRFSQDMMKYLLKADLSKETFIKPYDFIDSDGKRAAGLSFRQDGEKVPLKNDNAPFYEGDWSNKKAVKRFFEDLADWLIAEIQETIIPQLSKGKAEAPKAEAPKAEATKAEAPKADKPKVKSKKTESKEEKVELTPLQKKKFLKEYIAENYPEANGDVLSTLSKDDVAEWYELAIAMEELPFPEEEGFDEFGDDDLDAQLDALVG